METFEIFNDELVKYSGTDKKVIVPKSVTAIRDFAFYGCEQLETVQIPSSVKTIGSHAFYGCEHLLEISLPDTLQSIGGGAFAYCRRLKTVHVPKAIHSIEKSTFYQCSHLKEVLLPKHITVIGHSAFGFCERLGKIDLPASLISLGDSAFESCLSLKAVILPDSVTEIGKKAFYRCTALEKLVVSKQLAVVGDSAFQTYGRLSFISNETLQLRPKMFDDNGHIHFAYGAKDKFGENYQWVSSYMPCLDLGEWKEAAQVRLLTNFLETYSMHQASSKVLYRQGCDAHRQALLDFLIEQQRYFALNQALEHGILTALDAAPYLNRISDREQRAKLMEYSHQDKSEEDAFENLEQELMDLF